jgi:hypothetical protein
MVSSKSTKVITVGELRRMLADLSDDVGIRTETVEVVYEQEDGMVVSNPVEVESSTFVRFDITRNAVIIS